MLIFAAGIARASFSELRADVGGAARPLPDDSISVSFRLETAPGTKHRIRDHAQCLTEHTFSEFATLVTMQDFFNAVDEKKRNLIAAFDSVKYL